MGDARSRNERRPVSVQTAGPRYFDTLGLQMLRGRAFEDVAGANQVVVNERFAAKYFPNVNPIGATIAIRPANAATAVDSPLRTIVGVAPSLYQQDGDAPDAVVYLPYRANELYYLNLQVILRRNSNTEAIVARVREAVRGIDPDLPVFDASTFDEWLAVRRAPERVFGTMFTVFAGMALLLAGIGLYAVVAHSVSQRTHEIGVRMALGARRAHIHWLVMQRGLAQLATGLVLGLAGALGVVKLLQGAVTAQGSELPTLAVVTAVLVAVALSACFWPARRAVRLDPTQALRSE